MHVWLNDLEISWSVHLCMACDMCPTVSIIDVSIRIVTLFSSLITISYLCSFPYTLIPFLAFSFHSIPFSSILFPLFTNACAYLWHPLLPNRQSLLPFIAIGSPFRITSLTTTPTCVWKNCPHTPFRCLLTVTVCSTSSWKLQVLASLQKWWEKWCMFHNNLRNCLPCLGFF